MPEFYFYIKDLFEGTYTARIVAAFVDLFIRVAPIFFISIVINIVLQRVLRRRVSDLGRGSVSFSIVFAALLGLISPFPTYLAVPLGMSLVSAGYPLSAVVAFMISSPLMNPGIFILTWSQLGWQIAVARVLTAFLLALVAGLLVKLYANAITPATSRPASDFSVTRPLWIELYRTIRYIGRYFLLAIFLGALVQALVPVETIQRLLGGQGGNGLLIAVALGVPFYSCGGAAIPLIQVLSEMGMSKGAVLAFFISGPATKVETVVVYKSLMGLKFTLFYLLFIGLGALVSGFLFGLL